MMKIIDEKVDGILSAIHLIEYYLIPTLDCRNLSKTWIRYVRIVFLFDLFLKRQVYVMPILSMETST